MTEHTHDRRGFLKALLIGVVTVATLPLFAPPAAADELDDFAANAQGGKKGKKSRKARRRRATRKGRRKGK